MTRLYRVAALLIVLPLAVAAPEAFAFTTEEEEFTCPLTGEKFRGQVVGSHTHMPFGYGLDLRPLGQMLIIEAELMPKCPGSRFPVFREDFSELELAKLRALVETAEYKAARATHTDYYMVAWIERRLGAIKPSRLANILLRATWEAERGDPARLAAYRAEARDVFDIAAAESGVTLERKLTAQLLAAEMERLLGRFDQAVARIEAMSGTDWSSDQLFKSWAAEIERWARVGNARPQSFVARDR